MEYPESSPYAGLWGMTPVCLAASRVKQEQIWCFHQDETRENRSEREEVRIFQLYRVGPVWGLLAVMVAVVTPRWYR